MTIKTQSNSSKGRVLKILQANGYKKAYYQKGTTWVVVPGNSKKKLLDVCHILAPLKKHIDHINI